MAQPFGQVAFPAAPIEHLTPAEMRGYHAACDTLEKWGMQILKQGVSLPGPSYPINECKMMEHAGKMIVSSAELLRIAADR